MVNLKCVNYAMLIKLRYFIIKFNFSNKNQNIDSRFLIQKLLLKKRYRIV